MTEKRYYTVDYDEQYYIFDSNVIRKGRVEEEAEYSYDVFANSMSSTEIIDKLNELTNENEQLKQAYQTLKSRHSLLHDECLEAECDRDGYHKDVVSLEKENAQLRDKLSKYDSIAEKICEWDFDEIVKVMNAQQETEKENEQLKQTIKTIKKLCNQNKIPSLLTTYIPVNCEKRKGCLDNHMVNATNMGKSNIAKEILKMIDGDSECVKMK